MASLVRCYLAGPMRGIADNNAPAFAAAAAHLRALGHEVWSPAEHDENLNINDSANFVRRVFRRDLDALLQQDAIVLLAGWNRSHGACLERHAADVCSLQVYLFEPSLPTALVALSPHDWRWRFDR